MKKYLKALGVVIAILCLVLIAILGRKAWNQDLETVGAAIAFIIMIACFVAAWIIFILAMRSDRD